MPPIAAARNPSNVVISVTSSEAPRIRQSWINVVNTNSGPGSV